MGGRSIRLRPAHGLLLAALLIGGCQHTPDWAKDAWDSTRDTMDGLATSIAKIGSSDGEPVEPQPSDATGAVVDGGEASTAGQGPEPVTRIAFGSCADQRRDQPIWASILGAEPDLFLFLGDNVYGDVGPEFDPADAELSSLRAAYKALGRQPGFQTLRASVPILATWDDHDYGLNDAGAEFPHRKASEALFRDFWGVPDDDPSREGIYRAQIFGPPGQRVQIVLLDTRSFRSPLKPTDQRDAPGKERYIPDPSRDKTLLGAEQWSWLEGELRKPAELRLVVSSIQVIAEGHGYERWGNLPREREALFDLVARTGANGVVFLSGDRHLGALYRQDGGAGYPLFEVTASSLNRPATSITYEAGPRRIGAIYNRENFGVVEVDWRSRMLSLQLRGLDGQAVRSYAVRLDDLEPRAGSGASVRR